VKVKLAEALLRRKELQNKVDVLKTINAQGLLEVRVKRQRVTDDIDDVVASVPRVRAEEITAAFDWHARRLRMIDALIQQANWTCELDVDETVMADYITPDKK